MIRWDNKPLHERYASDLTGNNEGPNTGITLTNEKLLLTERMSFRGVRGGGGE